jgi:hypothetical protein
MMVWLEKIFEGFILCVLKQFFFDRERILKGAIFSIAMRRQ